MGKNRSARSSRSTAPTAQPAAAQTGIKAFFQEPPDRVQDGSKMAPVTEAPIMSAAPPHSQDHLQAGQTSPTGGQKSHTTGSPVSPRFSQSESPGSSPDPQSPPATPPVPLSHTQVVDCQDAVMGPGACCIPAQSALSHAPFPALHEGSPSGLLTGSPQPPVVPKPQRQLKQGRSDRPTTDPGPVLNAVPLNPSARQALFPDSGPLLVDEVHLGSRSASPPPRSTSIRRPSATDSARPLQSPFSDSDPDEAMSWREYIRFIPTRKDFQNLIQEVRQACRSEINVLREDFQHLTNRVESVESDLQSTNHDLQALQALVASQSSTIRDLQRHVEDLDNRGRRNNIRIKGLPEATGSENLSETLQAIFNNILGEPSSHTIEIDRAHRALRPRGSTSQPRDVICRIHAYSLKEEIMQKARNLRNIEFDGAPISLFPDLSWHTLQQRRLLLPLLTILRDDNIQYRWGFPFSLTARRDGRSATLRVPEDLPSFCSTLAIPCPKVPGWEPIPSPPPPPQPWQAVPVRKRSRPQGSPRAS